MILIPIIGHKGSGKTMLLKQCAVGLDDDTVQVVPNKLISIWHLMDLSMRGIQEGAYIFEWDFDKKSLLHLRNAFPGNTIMPVHVDTPFAVCANRIVLGSRKPKLLESKAFQKKCEQFDKDLRSLKDDGSILVCDIKYGLPPSRAVQKVKSHINLARKLQSHTQKEITDAKETARKRRDKHRCPSCGRITRKPIR